MPNKVSTMVSKGGPVGNQKAKKLTTSKLCKEAYKQYCAHIESGKSKEAWCFDHPELTLTSKTMEKYIRENPAEFPSIQKERAETKSYDHWCELGKDMMVGKVKGCQPAIYQMFMRNKFGWDKETHNSESNKDQAASELDGLREQKRPSADTQI